MKGEIKTLYLICDSKELRGALEDFARRTLNLAKDVVTVQLNAFSENILSFHSEEEYPYIAVIAYDYSFFAQTSSMQAIVKAMRKLYLAGILFGVCKYERLFTEDVISLEDAFDIMEAAYHDAYVKRAKINHGKKQGRPKGSFNSPLDRVRDVVEKYYYEDNLSIKEIAKRLNVSYGALFSWMTTRGIRKKKKPDDKE